MVKTKQSYTEKKIETGEPLNEYDLKIVEEGDTMDAYTRYFFECMSESEDAIINGDVTPFEEVKKEWDERIAKDLRDYYQTIKN